MKKYLFLAACITLQGSNAQVELNVALNDQNQIVLLEENQQEVCVFGDLNITIKNVKENEDSVELELAIGEFSPDQIIVEFGNNISLDLETDCRLEISAAKK